MRERARGREGGGEQGEQGVGRGTPTRKAAGACVCIYPHTSAFKSWVSAEGNLCCSPSEKSNSGEEEERFRPMASPAAKEDVLLAGRRGACDDKTARDRELCSGFAGGLDDSYLWMRGMNSHNS